MNTSIRERTTRAAGRWTLGLAFMLPLAAGAAAPTVSFSSIVATPQTNYNGSAVTATFAGELGGYTVALKVGNTSYAGTIDGSTVTFVVPGNAVVASNIYLGTITATKDSDTYTIGGKYLYQGSQISGGGGTNAWFKTWATGTAVNNEAGAWKVGDATKNPLAADSKILIDENDDGDYEDFVFTPSAAANPGQVVVVDMDLSFDAALDVAADLADAQAAISVVADGTDNSKYRFAAFANGVWTTNTTRYALLDTEYPVRMTFNYRQVPATVTYEVLTSSVYELIASGVAGTTESALGDVTFNGTGKLVVMTASNVVDSVDASLVKDAEHPADKYANIGAALANNVTNLTLLWNTAWQPSSGAGEFRIAQGDYNWYYTPENGLFVKLENGTYVVITDYWETMNLIGGAGTKYMFLTNVLKLAETDASLTNLYLLRDVALPAGVNVYRDTWFNGESNILSGAGLAVLNGKFTIIGGCIGIAESACTKDAVVLKGGRYMADPGWTAPSGYKFVNLAVAVREGYTKQLMKSDDAPTTDQELLPMTDANGESVSVVVNTDWVNTKVPGTAAEQSVALSKVQDNGLTRFDNEVLGLAKDGAVTANNIPVITPVQSSTADKVTFSLGNVKQEVISASGAKVTYRVVMSSNPGGKDGAASTNVVSTANVQMPLPSSGVQYYIIEVDTGAVK